MTRFKAHICFVSDQPLPNILPILSEQMKPEKVYLLCSDQQSKKGHGESQKAVLEHHGVKVRIVPVTDAFDMDNIEAAVDELIEQHGPGEIAFNATGGTKLMSIAAFERCQCKDVSVFYVQTPDIIWLPRQEDNRDMRIPYSSSLKLKDFLLAHGVDLHDEENAPIDERHRELARFWANRAEKYASAYSALNYYAANAEKDLSFNVSLQDRKQPPPPYLENLLEELEHEKWITFHKTGNKDQKSYKFKDEKARLFVNGGWLEMWVFHELQSIQQKQKYPQISIVTRNVQVQQRPGSTRKPVKNELDVVAIVNHRMWVFECKTSRLGKPQDKREGEQMIYKLAGTMKNMGGLRTQGCVVSFNRLRDEEKSRAELLEIKVIDGHNLHDLKSRLVTTLELKA